MVLEAISPGEERCARARTATVSGLSGAAGSMTLQAIRMAGSSGREKLEFRLDPSSRHVSVRATKRPANAGLFSSRGDRTQTTAQPASSGFVCGDVCGVANSTSLRSTRCEPQASRRRWIACIVPKPPRRPLGPGCSRDPQPAITQAIARRRQAIRAALDRRTPDGSWRATCVGRDGRTAAPPSVRRPDGRTGRRSRSVRVPAR